MIHYNEAHDIKSKIRQISLALGIEHFNTMEERIFCVRSQGSKSRRIIARCHALPKIMQKALSVEPAYIIEVISENFDNLSDDEKMKTLIHELLHIPKAFGGGFRGHHFVTRARVEKLFEKFRHYKTPSIETFK